MRNFNDWLAVKITGSVGTMWCAYIFAVIGIVGVVATLTNDVWTALVIGAVSSYFFQLVLIPVIIVGQNLQNEMYLQHNQKLDEHSAKLDAVHEHLGIGDNE